MHYLSVPVVLNMHGTYKLQKIAITKLRNDRMRKDDINYEG